MAGKILDLDDGKYMVVADIHGNLKDYNQIMNVYSEKKEAGEVDGLIFAGDTIHGYDLKSPDDSKAIVDDLMANSDENVHMLLGNHELSQICPDVFPLGELSKRFSESIKDDRQAYIEFFQSLPIYARTKGGVTIGHAGATDKIDDLDDIVNLSYEQLDKDVLEFKESQPAYIKAKGEYLHGLAIESLNKGMSTNDPELQKNIGNHLKLDPDKPEDMKKIQKYFLTNMVYGRIVGSTGLDPEKEEDQKKIKVLMDQALIQSLQREFDDAEGEEFDKNYPDMDKVNRSEKEVSRLHDIVFNLNEEARTVDGRLVVNQASIEQYKSNIDKFLDVMSKDYNPQRVILSGHMHQEYGFDIFEGKQVRISSSEGVSEESLKSYIILDAETGYSFAMDLARNIQPLYEDAIDKELLKKINKIAKKYGGIFNSQDSEKLSNIVKVYNNASDGLKDLIELKQPEEKGKDSFGSLIDTEAYCEFETERRRYSILLSGLKMVLDSAEKKSFNSPKIRSFVINQNLIDVIEKLENHNIKINKLSTNGYSFYNVFYDIGTKKENQSENKEPTYIQIGKEGLTDVKGKNTMHYTLTSDGTFGRRIVLPVPQEVEDEQGNKGVLFRGEGFLVTDKNKQDLIEGVKEQAKYGLAQKHVVESIIDIVFKGSEIFEQPYTDKSEQEFINEILGELKDKE